ncbi:hypothetical protein ACFE04_023495 [Oxalis oulophora]
MNFNRRRADSLPLFTPKKPQFFKIIFTSTIRQGKLGIPKEFVRNYGGRLQNQVTLKVLPDAEWKIGLKRSKKGIWLKHGWKNFVHYYSLAHGTLLLFRYDKKSRFSVTILDMSTSSEIEYPYEEGSESETEDSERLEESETEDSDYNEVFDKCSKIRQKPQLSSNSKSHKNIRTNSATKSQDGECAQGRTCHELANKFTSEYPFFRIVVGTSHMNSVTAPWKKFTEKLSKHTLEKEITIQVGEKSWPINFIIYPEHKQGKFGSGWKVFVREISLQIGDNCVFELINKNDGIVKVYIFKNDG